MLLFVCSSQVFCCTLKSVPWFLGTNLPAQVYLKGHVGCLVFFGAAKTANIPYKQLGFSASLLLLWQSILVMPQYSEFSVCHPGL